MAAMETLLRKYTSHRTSRNVPKMIALDISSGFSSARTDQPAGFSTFPDAEKLRASSPRCFVIEILVFIVLVPGATCRRCVNVETFSNLRKCEIFASEADNTGFLGW